jgi:hypothetical protein
VNSIGFVWKKSLALLVYLGDFDGKKWEFPLIFTVFSGLSLEVRLILGQESGLVDHGKGNK